MIKKCLKIILLVSILLSACNQSSTQPTPETIPTKDVSHIMQGTDNSNTSLTGFYWPTGEKPNVIKEWLASNCFGQKNYRTIDGVDKYHIGIDIDATARKTNVIAISSGKVVAISDNKVSGWGSTDGVQNKGVIIEHVLEDGTPFIAIYGHLQSNLIKGDYVKAGMIIGTIGDWKPPHLHLTISPYPMDMGHLGMMDCPESEQSYNTNGTVDPLKWLNTQYPGEYHQGEVQGVVESFSATKPIPTDVGTIQLNTIQIGRIYSSFTLYYNGEIWNPVEYSNGIKQLALINSTDCIIGESEGMGAPESWKSDVTQEHIGNYDFQVEQWTDTNTNKIRLISFNNNENNIFISIIPGDNPDLCVDRARSVITISADNGFSSTN